MRFASAASLTPWFLILFEPQWTHFTPFFVIQLGFSDRYSSYVFIFFHFLRPRNKINITAAIRIRGKKDATGLLIADGAACAYAIDIIVNMPYFGDLILKILCVVILLLRYAAYCKAMSVNMVCRCLESVSFVVFLRYSFQPAIVDCWTAEKKPGHDQRDYKYRIWNRG